MSKIKVVPCSGIGKVFGLMARESALRVTDVLASDICETACLAHIVSGDDEARAKVEGLNCISVDGCPALCAAKSIKASGGIVKAEFRVVDIMKEHRGKNAGDGTALSEEGWIITDDLADRIAAKAIEIAKEVE
ncbi:putative zinc-binding protein [Fusibacter sp. 3D3]|uniref:putative zinc-binding protein n=1 Tax=Fusibacter sp. 3D3 TaxID=1048380 RepID=UPI000853E88B|nr:putative zinc-binding protein [Fusibacter sp. 3D3]GAU76000.1 hypothetical protein F3D3_0596 [Fusibacter sp. 3D3]